MPKVTHFEFEADNCERAAKFFTSVFGWKIKQWPGMDDYWTVDTGKGKGIGGGLSKKHGTQHVTNMIEVPSVNNYITKIKKAGGKIIMDKTSIEGVGYFANFKDTEGNIWGIMELDKKAK
jgi:uncharacterized protein